MTTDPTSQEHAERDALVRSISGCFSNVSNLPEWMQIQTLGRDTTPLLEIAAEALLASDWLAARVAAARAEAVAGVHRILEAWDQQSIFGGAPDMLTRDQLRDCLRAVVSREPSEGDTT